MNEKAMNIRNAKRRGEWVELRFMAAAAENGLHVTKPWGDSAQYDFILERQSRFLRIQVKSTKYRHGNRYPLNMRRSGSRHYEDAFDFLAAYVIPEDVWYIIPVHDMRLRSGPSFHRSRETSRYWKYRGAWELLKEAQTPQPVAPAATP